MQALWDFLVRFRTWLIGVAGIIVVMLPDLIAIGSQVLNAPQIIAVLPDGWKTWASAIGFALLIWSRWRPATRAADTEVQVAQAIKRTGGRARVVVDADGEDKAIFDA